MNEAEVVCRQLGYGSAVSALGNASFGQGPGNQWKVHFYCSGTESSLQSCHTSSGGCSHSEDASVKCTGSRSGELIIGIFDCLILPNFLYEVRKHGHKPHAYYLHNITLRLVAILVINNYYII